MTVRRSRFGLVLGLPMFLWQAAFFVAPLLFLVAMTFWSVRNFRLRPDFTLANWEAVLSAGFFQNAFVHTFVLSSLAALCVSLLALPVSYVLAFKAPSRWRLLLAGLLLVPFFTSFPVRIYSMQIFFSPSGIIHALVSPFGLTAPSILNTPAGTFIGYLTLTAPLVILLQTIALGAVDRTLVQAAHNLGCGRMATVFRIVVPSARVGLVLAAAFAFILCFGDYISPQFLGGSNPPTLSILIADQVKSGNHWPRASVVAVVMIVTLTAVLGILMKLAYGRRPS